MKDWKRTLAALLAAIMLVMPFGATAEPELELNVLPEADAGLELEIAPEAIGDATDLELELPDASELDELDIEDIDLDAVTLEDVVIDDAEAEAGNPVLSNDDDYDDDDYDDDDDYTYDDDDIDFHIDDDGVLVHYWGDGGHVVIPDGVTSIGKSVFEDCDDLTSVTIPASVTSIEVGAFYDCDNLTSVTIPASVTSIGDEAFYSCESLTSVTIPASVTSIGEYAFAWCESLTSVTIPASVTSIGDWAFCGCESLTSVTIPASVTIIGNWAFTYCDSLQAINVSSKNTSYTSNDGILYTHDMKTLFQCPGAKTKVNIPNGVTKIGGLAFINCDSLTSVTIPASVTSIGYEAFGYCDSLAVVTILSESIDIHEDAFEGSDPTFHIIEGSDARNWAAYNDFEYDTFTEGLSQHSLSLEVGQTHKLTVRVQGNITTNVTWSSSDTTVATVKDGTVTAIREGSCTITATLSNGKALKCALNVNDPAVLSKTELSMNAGATYELKVSKFGNRTVTWSSSDTTVATVKAGTVTAIREGSCTITATLSNGKALKCALNVKDVAKLSKAELSLNVGSTYTLKVSSLGNRTVTWSSSDDKVATVKDGTVTAIREGACTITATPSNGKALKCTLTVKDPAVLSKTVLSLNVGATDTLKVSNLGNRTVTWSSSDDKVATVKAGTVTAIREGSCTITATLSNGKALNCVLTVKDPAKLSKAELSMNIGKKYALKVSDLGNRTVTWSSSDTTVATVKDGTVTAIKAGKCSITATLSNGRALNCALSVKDAAELSKTELSINIGAKYALKVTNLGNRTVTWSSSGTTVATVKAGTVTAIKAGNCTITAKVTNGKTLTCKVTVKDAAKLFRTKLAMKAGATSKLKIINLGHRTVTWSSSDKKVATVKGGTVTAIKAGKCTITAKIKNGKTLKCKVTVRDAARLSKTKLSLNVGRTYKLKVNEAGNRTVTWSSSDKSIATVKNGTVTAIKAGKCTITATPGNGKALKCILTVKDPAWISKTKLSMNAGATTTLKVYRPGTRKVTWSSSDKKVATVKNGTVTAIKAGKCTITATLSNGQTFDCKVTVKDAARFTETKLSLKPGESQTLRISGLYGREVAWTSSDEKIATVKNGTVTAVYIGSCTVTAQIKDGKKLTCRVTVTDAAALSNDKLTISNIDTDRITLTGGLNRKVTWSTSNKNVVEITGSDNDSASIKAVKNGTATITAKVEGGKTLKCVVKVVDPLTIKEGWYDDDFDDLYSWEVGVKFTNHSNKKIIYVTFDILQYNNRGDRLQSPYDYYYFNNDIAPHDYRYDNYTVNDDTRSVKFKVTEVTFADKTTWRP